VVNRSGFGDSTINAIRCGRSADCADAILSASKSMIGLIGRGMQPLGSSRGASELVGVPDGSPEERTRKLQLAERLLMRNASETDQRYSWKAHVISLGMNLVGGLVIWLVGDLQRAAISTGVAIDVGELSIWAALASQARPARVSAPIRPGFPVTASESGPRRPADRDWPYTLPSEFPPS
jgi:hypothetical protein